MDFAQTMHRSEVKLRTYILGEPAKHIRPLSETRYVFLNMARLTLAMFWCTALWRTVPICWQKDSFSSSRHR
jgi:optic atrophy 3 protein